MRQTGQFKAVVDGKKDDFKQKVTIIFIKQNNSEITRSTDDNGAFDFDVPNGEYYVKAFVANSERKNTYDFRAGLLFVVNAQTKIDALNLWIGGGAVEAKDPMQDWWIAQFTEAKKNVDHVDQVKKDMENGSVGSGFWLREGASKIDALKTFGSYYGSGEVKKLDVGDSGLAYARLFIQNNPGLDFTNTGINPSEFLYYEVQKNYSSSNSAIITFKGYRGKSIIAQALMQTDYTWSKPVVFYNTDNTTVDANGSIKKASPIIKLFDDHIEWNQDFKEAPIFEKIATGTYKISNTHGLAREGWTYEKPRGKDGNFYFKIKVQKLDDGCIVSVHDYFIDYEDVTIIDDAGNKRTVKKQIEVLSQARDIKLEERWIDLRFFEKIYDLTNEPPKINIPYHPLWGIEPYIPPVVEQIEEENIALLDQRAF